ncbi:hypothetical protein D1BOALGB6SA_7351 [Olavius sp. associated proteobacterium Delta 1]|nr:hypothetical protein D1BOALGB6SA_7351 [Olavius sp. associated proteobacterium Delta 1]
MTLKVGKFADSYSQEVSILSNIFFSFFDFFLGIFSNSYVVFRGNNFIVKQ